MTRSMGVRPTQRDTCSGRKVSGGVDSRGRKLTTWIVKGSSFKESDEDISVATSQVESVTLGREELSLPNPNSKYDGLETGEGCDSRRFNGEWGGLGFNEGADNLISKEADGDWFLILFF